eukprot:9689793-Prorocentrum_lima.AAC.1
MRVPVRSSGRPWGTFVAGTSSLIVAVGADWCERASPLVLRCEDCTPFAVWHTSCYAASAFLFERLASKRQPLAGSISWSHLPLYGA